MSKWTKTELQDMLKQSDINFNFVFNAIQKAHDILDLPGDTWQNKVNAVVERVRQLQAERLARLNAKKKAAKLKELVRRQIKKGSKE